MQPPRMGHMGARVMVPLQQGMQMGRRYGAMAADLKKVDSTLCDKIQSELEFEENSEMGEMVASRELPKQLNDFLKDSQFEVLQKPGERDVKLVKTIGNEVITVTFDVEQMYIMDQQMDEDMEEGGREEMEEALEEMGGQSITVTVDITKSAKEGALSFQVNLTANGIDVEQIQCLPTGISPSSESDAAKRAPLFNGPDPTQLDEELCDCIVEYLEERGVNSELHAFIEEYMTIKEGGEYIAWLRQLKTFIKA